MGKIKELINKIKELVNKIKTVFQNLISKIGKGKVLHFICAFVITLIPGLILGNFFGLAAGLCATLLKDVYREYREDGTGWNWKNIIADIIGIVAAMLLL